MYTLWTHPVGLTYQIPGRPFVNGLATQLSTGRDGRTRDFPSDMLKNHGKHQEKIAMRLAIAVAACLFATAAAAGPEARMETNMGTIVIALDADKAPATVANFIRYAKQGHYNGTIFYRVVPDFVIQAGSLGADGKWRPLHKPIPLETATGLSNTRGTIAMAREDGKPVSALAEFFINLADVNATGLDAKPGDVPNTTGYAVFGHVTSGMDVVDAIAAVPLGGGKGPFPANDPLKPVIIRKVTIGEAPAAPAQQATPDQSAAPAAPPTGQSTPQ
jgi:cyclophilin family peptidyl-prolyl cis-trans isomerase